MTAEQVRTSVFASLAERGFRVAASLPLPDMDAPVRTSNEIASRLMALDAVFTWVAFPEDSVATDRIENYIGRNALRDWLTEDETAIISLPRPIAHDCHADNIGWRLENMWSLAWAVGFQHEPTIEASQIGEHITRPMIYDFLPGLEGTVAKLLSNATPRSAEEVIALEYRFYCAHNAVRSAQLGGKTVPEGFHPIMHGGAVHERRHSLSWCIAPDVPWDETGLST